MMMLAVSALSLAVAATVAVIGDCKKRDALAGLPTMRITTPKRIGAIQGTRCPTPVKMWNAFLLPFAIIMLAKIGFVFSIVTSIIVSVLIRMKDKDIRRAGHVVAAVAAAMIANHAGVLMITIGGMMIGAGANTGPLEPFIPIMIAILAVAVGLTCAGGIMTALPAVVSAIVFLDEGIEMLRESHVVPHLANAALITRKKDSGPHLLAETSTLARLVSYFFA